MHPRFITRFIGVLIFFLGLAMTLPLLASLYYMDGCAWAFVWSASICCALGAGLAVFSGPGGEAPISHRSGAAVVTLGWITAGLVGTLPYLFSGAIPDFTDAYFESLSGFTTTGASILNRIEGLPEGVLLWRSLTQWLGGMGIIVLSLAVLPLLGVGGMQLYKAEVPSPVVDKLKPRISETARVLWKVYLLITLAEVLLLWAGGMSVFDAFSHAFCTMPTGGFSTKNASIAHYNSAYFDYVILFFMIVAGVNFSLHYRALKGSPHIFWKDPECRVFLGLTLVFTLAVTLDIHRTIYEGILDAFRYAAFQVGSIITTTGFATADYDQWPALSKLLLLLSMFLGGMAGSTGGGMKTMRVMLLVRHGYRELFRIVHPHAVTTVKLGHTAVPAEILSGIWGFFVLYLGIFIAASLILAAMGLDLVSSLAAVAASLGNIGPGLGTVGPVKNYFAVPMAGKWLLAFCMLLGRLEIFTVLVLLTPAFWRK